MFLFNSIDILMNNINFFKKKSDREVRVRKINRLEPGIMSGMFALVIEVLAVIVFAVACGSDQKSSDRRSRDLSDEVSEGAGDMGQNQDSADSRREASGSSSSTSPIPNQDIDPEAPFNLIPKEGDLSAKWVGLPQSESLSKIDSHHGKKTSTDYYLAINKKDLEKTWFLTAMTKQIYPVNPDVMSPFINLGTRVVQFKEQNDKLYVFDVSQRKSAGGASDPTVLIDAYPIIPHRSLPKGYGSLHNFVVFDPALGVSQNGPIQDIFAARTLGALTFKTDLRYMRSYDKLSDGIYYEMAFSGVTEGDLTKVGTVDNQDSHPGRVVGTLGMSIRRYKTTPGFKTFDVSDLKASYYFAGESASKNPQQGGITNPVWKWGRIKPGMEPIVFWLSPEIAQSKRDYPQYDIKGSIIRGFEAWNEVFGFKVFEVRQASSQTSWAADDTNMIIWDPKGNIGYAYADMRINPNTGEIRGANIYMDPGALSSLEDQFKDLPAAGSEELSRLNSGKNISSRLAKRSAFSWGSMTPQFVCARSPSSMVLGFDGSSSLPFKNQLKLNRKSAMENWVAAVITHEVGHVLGLRHNFLGSTYRDEESSSIMDYIRDSLQIYQTKPGVYDVDAVKFLYGLAPNPPQYPFCTDEDLQTNPVCRKFDAGVKPLETDLIPILGKLKETFQNEPNSSLEESVKIMMQQVLDYFQGGDLSQKTKAWTGLMENLKSNEANPPRESADTLAQWVVDGAFMTANPTSQFSLSYTQNPRLDPGLAPQVTKDLAAIALNGDKIRSLPSRILAIQALRKVQNPEGLKALTQLKQDLTKRKATLSADDAIVENDLILRIEKHLTPYFDGAANGP